MRFQKFLVAPIRSFYELGRTSQESFIIRGGDGRRPFSDVVRNGTILKSCFSWNDLCDNYERDPEFQMPIRYKYTGKANEIPTMSLVPSFLSFWVLRSWGARKTL